MEEVANENHNSNAECVYQREYINLFNRAGRFKDSTTDYESVWYDTKYDINAMFDFQTLYPEEENAYKSILDKMEWIEE